MHYLRLALKFVGFAVLGLLCALLMFAVSTSAFALELPSGSTAIARWRQNNSSDRVDYRGADGAYYAGTVNRNNGKLRNVSRISLATVHSDLIQITDYAVVGLNPLWGIDSDGDGHSDMQEYLTDGDPYDASIVPLTPWVKSYAYRGEVKILEVSIAPDLKPPGGNSGSDTGGGTGENAAPDLGKIELLLTVLVHLVAVFIGLFLWRLFILSKSQKNLI